MKISPRCYRFQMANAVATTDPAGNRKIDKDKARFRIDGAVALAMAVGLKARDVAGDIAIHYADVTVGPGGPTPTPTVTRSASCGTFARGDGRPGRPTIAPVPTFHRGTAFARCPTPPT